MQAYNNWLSYSFDGVEYGPKTAPNSLLKFNFNYKIDKKLPTYKEALINNAIIMRDSYNEPFDVCLSGGTDSEVVVRTFKDLGITHNTFIFRLEDDHNIRDVNMSIDLCNELNIAYKIIDFPLKKFYDNEAVGLLNKTFIPMAGELPRLKFLDYLDNIPVFGTGDAYWKREFGSDYSKKSTWHFQLREYGLAVAIYSRLVNRTVIDWHQYTPEVIMSYKEHPLIDALLNDRLPGKTSTISSRAPLHQEIWPSMRFKPKLAGYEGATLPSMHRPEFMNQFYNKYMSHIKEQICIYTVDELDSLIFK